tara:strand:- start:254 stop:919 length:666 start_codon:yes stop_codon:yes gene_type:complete
MNKYLEEILLFYIPIVCLMILSPGAFSNWWKANISGPVILILVFSLTLSFISRLFKKKYSVSASSNKQSVEYRPPLLNFSVNSGVINIGQSDNDSQLSITGLNGLLSIKTFKLTGEGVALILCFLNNEENVNFDKEKSGEILIDSGELWIYDSSSIEYGYELTSIQENDSTIKQIVDADQLSHGYVIYPPYGDGSYNIWLNKTGFLIELIPDTKQLLECSI